MRLGILDLSLRRKNLYADGGSSRPAAEDPSLTGGDGYLDPGTRVLRTEPGMTSTRFLALCFVLALGPVAGCSPPDPQAAAGSRVPDSAVLPAALPRVTGAPADSAVQLVFFDVGQGDAILIRSPEGKAALIDGGRDAAILGKLRRYGVTRLDLVIATHAHADHIGGLVSVLRHVPVRFFLDNGVPYTTSTYANLMRAVRRSQATYLRPTARTLNLGSVALRILAPPAPGQLPDRKADQNDTSVGVVVRFGQFRALLTGDSEVGELHHWLHLGVPRVAILKAAHHGSRNGVTPAWLAATRPEVVVISVGRDNPYGHPHPWALRYYGAVAKKIYRTDRDGDVRVWGGRDGRYRVTLERTTPAALR